MSGREADPEPTWNEQGRHGLPPALPEIVSGNRGALPAGSWASREIKLPASLVLAASQLTLLTGRFDLRLSGANPVPQAALPVPQPSPLREGIP